MERRSLNSSETESSDSAKGSERRGWPERAADFLQSWRERLLGKSGDSEEDDTSEVSDNNTGGWLKRMGRYTLRGLGIMRPERSEEAQHTDSIADTVPEYRIFSDDDPETLEELPPSLAEMPVDDLLIYSSEAELRTDSIDVPAEVEEEPAIPLDISETTPEEEPETAVTTGMDHERRTSRTTDFELERRHHHAEPLAAASMALGAAEHHRVTKLKKRTRKLEEDRKKDHRQTKDIKERYEELQREMKRVAQKMDRSSERPPEVQRTNEPMAKSVAPELVKSPEAKRRPETGITTVFERATPQSPLEKPHHIIEDQVVPEERPVPQEITLPPVETSEPKIELSKYEIHKEHDPYKVAAAEATPEAVLEEVEKAAEKNVPLEAFYERRQEVKDLDDVTGRGSVTTGAGGGGWVSPSLPPATPAAMPLTVPAASRTGENKLAELWNKQPKIYQQAMTTSAGAALLVTLVAAALMALLN